MRRLTVIGAVALAALSLAAGAWASWTAGASAGSVGESVAATVEQGATPTATLASSNSVTVSWGASTLSNGQAVDGYIVTRYDAASETAQTTLPGCGGTVIGSETTISCTESGVPIGSWKYTVTPVIGDHWQGQESVKSGSVTVAGTASLTVSPTVLAGPFPQTVTGSLAGFGANESISYWLDSTTPLSGSPSHANSSGDASVSIEVPNAGDGPHTISAIGDASQASASILLDTSAPTVTATLTPAANAAGWNNSSPVSVNFAADDGTGSGVEGIKYTTDGSDPTTSGTAQTYSAPFDISASGTTPVKFYATDTGGNDSTVQTQLVKIDTVDPANSLSLDVTSGNALLNGSTLWYRGADAGSFTIANAVSDALSRPASSATAPLSGDTSGWSHASSLVSTPAAGPYTSNAFSWSAGTSSAPSESVTGGDAADNFKTAALTFTNDSTGPTGGSVDATGLGGTGGRYSSSTTLSIAFDSVSDAGVGLAANGFELQRESGTLSSSDGLGDGSCSYSGGFSTIATDPTSPYTDDAANGISSGHCYKYRYVVADKLGNTTTHTSGDVKVETSAPSSLTPTPTLSNATGDTFVSGTTVYTNPQSGKSGSFQVAATPTDAASGIQGVDFPSLTGFTSGGGNVGSSPFGTTYSWSGPAATASGAKTVTATNNATQSETATFTVTPDTANPTIAASAKKADDSTYTAGTWTNQTVTAHYACSDGGSGVGSCTADQLFSSDGVTASTSGTASDNVGNSASATFTGPIRVDKTSPTITASAKNADNSTYTAGTWTKQTVTVHYTCSDPTVNGASSGVSSCPADQVFSSSGVTTASGTATDNAANSASASFGSVKVDKTAPTNALSLVNQSTQSGPAGTTNPTSAISGANLYYDSGAAGNFKIQNALADSGSGPASSLFAAFSGSASGWSFTSSTVSTPSGGPYVSNQFSWNSGTTTTPSESVTGTDALGQSNTPTTLTMKPDNTNPSVTITFPASSGTYTDGTWDAAGSCATSTICGTASDSGTNASGVGKVQVSIQATSGTNINKYWDPAANGGAGGFTSASEALMLASGTTNWSLGFPASNLSDAKYTVKAYAVDNVGNFASDSNTNVTIDNVEPASSASLSQTPNAAGWNNASTFTVTLNANDAVSGVASITYSATGANPISTTTSSGSSKTITISNQGTTTISFHATDNAGNVESPDNTQVVKYDKTAPANSLSLVNQSGGASFLSGTKVFYKGPVAGQFQIQNAVADSTSGPASSLFGALGGTSTGWSFTSSTVTAPSGGPYVSNIFSWLVNTTSSPTEVVTGADVAGNTLAASTLTLTNDSTAPTTTSNADANWHNAPVTVTLTPTDGSGSGVASTTYQADGGSAQSGTSILFPAPADHSADGTHTLNFFSTDNLGNLETTKAATVKIDTADPTGGFSHPSNGGSYTSSTWPSAAFDGTASDALSGVGSVTINISRTFDGKCLNGGRNNWVSCPQNVTATGTTSWSSPVTHAELTNGMSSGNTSSFTATITITDAAGNTATAPITFTAKA